MELIGTSGNDTLTGGSANDTISGDSGNDLLDGAGGNDSLLGGAGDDHLLGQTGDDSLYGGKGNDTLDGGDGIDSVFYNVANAVTVNLVTGQAGDGSNGTDTLIGIENVYSGDGNDSLTGDAGDNFFSPGTGFDAVNGGAGLDTVGYQLLTTSVSANLSTGLVFVDGIDAGTLASIERLIGSAFDDTLTGGAGAEYFMGGAGSDSIDGGGGFDSVDYASSSAGASVTLGGASAGSASDGLGGTDVLKNIEEVRGSAFNDTLRGSDAATLEAFEGRDGNDSIDGFGGIDLASYESSPQAVSVNLATGTASDGWGHTDSLQNIEMVLGSDFNDTLTGGAGNDTLTGGLGDDTLDGGAGTDTAVFSGVFGDYIVSSGSSAGTITVVGPDGHDLLSNIELLAFDDQIFTVQQGTAGNDTLTGSAGDDALFGGAGTDSIAGGTGDDLIDGGEGADTMAGGSGNDTYIVDDEGDVVTEDSNATAAAKAPGDGALPQDIGSNIDKVVASINYTLGNFVENLTLSGTANLSGSGNALSNELAGNAGNNTLTGGAGNDHLNGGNGIDTAAFSTQRAQSTLTMGTTNVQVNAGADGSDTLEQVERLQFADIGVALDISGNAGRVAKILGVVFGSGEISNELYVGIGLDYADGGMTYEALMQLALDVRLGAGASHAAVVDLLYTNVAGAPPDAGTAAYYVGLLDNGTFTNASLALMAADTSYNASNINLAGLAQTGLEFV
jgi:Ca2+-binding RTX toxin-like protein